MSSTTATPEETAKEALGLWVLARDDFLWEGTLDTKMRGLSERLQVVAELLRGIPDGKVPVLYKAFYSAAIAAAFPLMEYSTALTNVYAMAKDVQSCQLHAMMEYFDRKSNHEAPKDVIVASGQVVSGAIAAQLGGFKYGVLGGKSQFKLPQDLNDLLLIAADKALVAAPRIVALDLAAEDDDLEGVINKAIENIEAKRAKTE